MKCKLLLKHQCKQSYVLFFNLMNTWWRSALQFHNASYGNTYNSSWRNHPNFSWKPKAPQYQQLAQPSQQASSLEQAIVNLSKAHYLEYCKGRVDFLLNLTKTPRVSMKWKLMRRIFTSERCQSPDHSKEWQKVELPTPKPHVEEEEEEETKKREEIKGKKKDIGEGKRTMIQR
ncbi:hypothetical protein AAG906_015308 [Vitis piasezkii]